MINPRQRLLVSVKAACSVLSALSLAVSILSTLGSQGDSPGPTQQKPRELIFGAFGTHVAGAIAYVAGGDGGLVIVDVSRPAQPVELGRNVDTNGFFFAHAVQVVGKIAYVAGGLSGFNVIDVGDPKKPTLVARLELWGSGADHLAVSGTNAFVTSFVGGLAIIDIAHPVLPQTRSSLEDQLLMDCLHVGHILTVHSAGSRIYVGGQFGLAWVDYPQPKAWKHIGRYPGFVSHVQAAGNLVYLDRYDGFEVLDISDPKKPSPVSQWRASTSGDGRAYGMCFSGPLILENITYLNGGEDGLYLVDVANPAKPTLTAIQKTEGHPESLSVDGHYAYASTRAGLEIFDVQKPDKPKRVGIFRLAGPPGRGEAP
jgi:hypothetical protein